MRGIRFFLLVALLITLLWQTAESLEMGEERVEIPISSALQLGPIEVPLPVFHNVKNNRGKTFKIEDLLKFVTVEATKWWPRAGEEFEWDHLHPYFWQEVKVDSGQVIIPSRSRLPQVAFLAFYVDMRRFAKIDLKLSSYHPFRVLRDGKEIMVKTATELPKKGKMNEPPPKSRQLALEPGKHLLLAKMVRDPASDQPWSLEIHLMAERSDSQGGIRTTIETVQRMTVSHLLDGVKLAGVSISPDGELAAVTLQQSLPPEDRRESWIEIRRVKDGRLFQTYRGGMDLSGLTWAPSGRMFSYTTSDKKGRTLWVVDLTSGRTIQLLKEIKNLGGHSWGPDASFIIYSVMEKAKENKTGLKKLQGMPDRWPGWRDRSFLYKVNVPQGTRIRLTSGKLSTNLNSISPDGDKILFTRSVADFSERPYSKTQFWLLHLKTMQLDSLWTSNWSGSARWSPDGGKLLIIGGPSMFGTLGTNVPDGMIPNEYDTQAYLYDLTTGEVKPITLEFNPAINQGIWSRTEPAIYFTTTDRSYRHLYRYDLRTREFKWIHTGVEVIGTFDLARNRAVAVYTGSGSFQHPKAYVIDLKTTRYRVLADPEAATYRYVKAGRVERWTFQNARGVEIEGRIYFPPDFDPEKKYPCIVYYYGGTSPVTRDFGGRYPKELWAANGYVVYVLQPSGATGFGQAFSSLHVNDWGKIVADEIITGTKKFLLAHPFVDSTRVGCIGASFGGFMTMLLQTKTDLFAAAVAHAGISLIPSYWGEGFWGYLYSAVATANSFPWNRRDIYVEQSPLFHADRVKTPILLLHGNADTNVPPGESRQFYAALKLLGKEVELIEIDGQNHHILAYNKRKWWTKTIIAWFDRWLKHQPEWWNELVARY